MKGNGKWTNTFMLDILITCEKNLFIKPNASSGDKSLDS